ncbi:MAG: hypothetical protein CVV47_03500 [Spirochaetae bacterium HGW-Spirochaetae-3]|jgi:hypothetical protein|nr:MAG: hypothetical protein CVV47_03500 [Spirochaetae bacterium HGW-Spirochaetae-3]
MLKLNTKMTRLEYFDKRMAAIRSAYSTSDDVTNRGRPGEIVRLDGVRMGFDKKDERVGVFFVNGVAVRSMAYHVNNSRIVAATIPADLEKGAYTLVVRTMPNGKDIAEGRYNKEFIIR